jgi:hypothetical protein
MEFKKLYGYKTGFAAMQVILIFVVIAAFAFAGFVYYSFSRSLNNAYSSVWVLDQRTGSLAQANVKESNSADQREIEYKAHVRDFYNHFYEMDQFTYKQNVEYALNLIGNSGKELARDYKNQDLLRKLQETNSRIRVYVDSIIIDMGTSPATGLCFARQEFETPAGNTQRYMNSKFQIVDLSARSLENPHACLLENFRIINNKKLEKEYE